MPQFQLRQRLLSLGDDFDISDATGQAVYKVDGKLLRLRQTLVIEDMEGAPLLTIRQKLVAIRKTMHILRQGEIIATIRKALVAARRDKFMIEVEGGTELRATGNLLDHEYEVRRGDDLIARVSKRWFTIRDTYGIDVNQGEDAVLVLAIAVAIDEMIQAADDEADDDDGR